MIALGVALACVALVWLARARLVMLAYAVLRPWIRRRLGGYRHRFHASGAGQATAPPGTRVAVVGAGLGGIAAAAHLGERGFEVTLIDAAPHLGGKIGAWRERAPDGSPLEMEHGFHAFFRHYYNLNAFLARLGALPMNAIDDYVIVGRDGRSWSFGRGEKTPLLNLVELARGGLFRMREIAQTRAIHEMDAFLTYDRARTFDALDHVSLERFAREAELPPALAMVFTTFGRAFFADASRMSMAEVIKSFHFYYLSHDHGLLYEYPTTNYREALLDPIARHLKTHGVRLRLGAAIERIERDGSAFRIDGAPFEHVVLAADVVGVRRIAEQSALPLPLASLQPSQRYAVLRLWIDRDLRRDIPVFVSLEGDVLDAVAVYHRITPEARRWAEQHGGAVLELHCYAVPDSLEDVRGALLRELVTFFEELAGFSIVHERLQVRADFSAFHVGMARSRPETTTAIPGLYLAGDWVKLPFPAMLMEAAFSAGLLAANAICAAHGVRTFDVWSVPPRGILFRDRAPSQHADKRVVRSRRATSEPRIGRAKHRS